MTGERASSSVLSATCLLGGLVPIWGGHSPVTGFPGLPLFEKCPHSLVGGPCSCSLSSIRKKQAGRRAARLEHMGGSDTSGLAIRPRGLRAQHISMPSDRTQPYPGGDGMLIMLARRKANTRAKTCGQRTSESSLPGRSLSGRP